VEVVSFTPRESPLVPIGYKAAWVAELFWVGYEKVPYASTGI